MPSLLRKTFFRLRILLQAILSPVAFGALALVEQGGKVVLIRHSYTAGWHLPGGGVQNGEPPEKAVMRELKEELGLTGASEPEFVGKGVAGTGWVVVGITEVVVWAGAISVPSGLAF